MSLHVILAESQRVDGPLLVLREVSIDGLLGTVLDGKLAYAAPCHLTLDARVRSRDLLERHVEADIILPEGAPQDVVSTPEVWLQIDGIVWDEASAEPVRYDRATGLLTIVLHGECGDEAVQLGFASHGGAV